MSAQQKALPLTKEEVMKLIELIEAHPVLFSKSTNATNNQLKETTWAKLTTSFNSMISSYPRKPEQLRLKWENLKKAARKRNKIRMKKLKAGGGKTNFIPPDEALDKVASILDSNCDGYSVPRGDDEIEQDDNSTAEKVEEQIVDPFDDNIEPHSAATQPFISPLHTSPSAKKISPSLNKGKLKCQAAADNVKASVIVKNRAIAQYYDAKKKQEEVMATLKKRKLELEILGLEKRIFSDPLDDNSDSDNDKSNQ